MTTPRESLWTVAHEDRPREKLQRLGPSGLTDGELVALVLGSGMPGVNVLDSAASLLAQAGGVTELMAMTVGELRALMGVGVATAGRVVAVAELWRRANDPPPGRVLAHPADVVGAVRAFLASRPPGVAAAVLVVIADSELRLRVVAPLVGREATSLVSEVLHEVLYRGGTAFALAGIDAIVDDEQLRAVRDVLKLAATTVGLRYLSTVRVRDDGWSPCD